MDHMDTLYPAYAFASHKGYGTPDHQRLLELHGPCPLHRRSFAPLRPRLEALQFTVEAAQLTVEAAQLTVEAAL